MTLRERFINAREIKWPRPRHDLPQEPSHTWARVEDRKRDQERAREWERKRKDREP